MNKKNETFAFQHNLIKKQEKICIKNDNNIKKMRWIDLFEESEKKFTPLKCDL